MKSSFLTTDNALHVAAHPLDESHHGSVIGRFAHAIYSRLNQMGTAIAIGEAGDLEAAQAWREQHGAN